MIAFGALTLIGSLANADARPHRSYGGRTETYVSGYRYGQPVYTQRIFVGYDRYGYPCYEYRVISPPRPIYRGDHCDTGYYGSPRRSGTSVTFTYRR